MAYYYDCKDVLFRRKIIKDGNNDAECDTVRGLSRILLWADAIAANVKSQQADISTLQTPSKYITNTIQHKLDTIRIVCVSWLVMSRVV